MEVLGYIARTAAFFLFLYLMPFFGHWKVESRLAVAAASAAIVAYLIWLPIDMLLAPASLHRQQVEKHAETVEALEMACQARGTTDALITLWKDGMHAYHEMASPAAYFDRMEIWAARATALIDEKLSDRERMMFANARYRLAGGKLLADADAEWMAATQKKRAQYTGMLACLRGFIENPSWPHYEALSVAVEAARQGREVVESSRI